MSNNRNIAVTNTAEFDHGALTEMFKALSNPHRLEIFIQLSRCCLPGSRWPGGKQSRACVGELGRNLGIVPSTVSHHIKELLRAGLIRTERKGQSIECWIDPQVLQVLSGFFSGPLADGRSGKSQTISG